MDAISSTAALDDVTRWRRDGAVILDRFFDADEIGAVVTDCDALFAARRSTHEALVADHGGRIGKFDSAQFRNQDHLPFDASPAINLIGLHPRLIAFAKAALGVDDVRLYQCEAWAKFTGDADYDQPFHCDFRNHTLTVPAHDAAMRTINCMIFVTDVADDLGAIHYVPNPQADAIIGAITGATHIGARLDASDGVQFGGAAQQALKAAEQSGAAPAGSIFAYGIDVYHRGTNLTRPDGHRYTITASFKAAGNDAIGYTAWPHHFIKPWRHVFDHANPEQLACLGVPRPGHAFWTEATLARAQLRWPGWDMAPWRTALAAA